MKAGKLPSDLLSSLLARLPADPRLLIGPGIGLDAAAIDLGEGRVLVAKADPITFATDEIGRYAVHVGVEGHPAALRRTLRIDGTGIALEPPVDAPAGTRLRVRLPVPAMAATIRRS